MRHVSIHYLLCPVDPYFYSMATRSGGTTVEVRDPELPESMDRDLLKDIMIYRALGYQQREIADELHTSQQTVSRYLNEIKSMSRNYDNPRSVFYGIFMAIFADIIMDRVLSD